MSGVIRRYECRKNRITSFTDGQYGLYIPTYTDMDYKLFETILTMLVRHKHLKDSLKGEHCEK